MKKKKLNLQRKLQLQKDVISGLSAAGQGAVQGGSTICGSLVNQEVCHNSGYPTCTDPKISGMGDISMCNPTELSKGFCESNNGPNTYQPCCHNTGINGPC